MLGLTCLFLPLLLDDIFGEMKGTMPVFGGESPVYVFGIPMVEIALRGHVDTFTPQSLFKMSYKVFITYYTPLVIVSAPTKHDDISKY